MKKTFFMYFLSGVVVGFLYLEKSQEKENMALYGARNVAVELKTNVDRANLVLDSVEKKYIKKNVPKPDVPKPDLSCKCNGTGMVIQADGNQSQCQCHAKPEGCTCKPKGATP